VDATASGAAGRTMVVGGPPPGKTGWDVRVDGLAPPPAARRRGKAAKPVLLTLRNAAVAFSPNAPAALGRSPGWLIDPLTGRPATERPWVIVIDRHAGSAAGLATAAAVLGRESGASLVRSWGAVAHFESSAAAAAPPPPR